MTKSESAVIANVLTQLDALFHQETDVVTTGGTRGAPAALARRDNYQDMIRQLSAIMRGEAA